MKQSRFCPSLFLCYSRSAEDAVAISSFRASCEGITASVFDLLGSDSSDEYLRFCHCEPERRVCHCEPAIAGEAISSFHASCEGITASVFDLLGNDSSGAYSRFCHCEPERRVIANRR